VIEAILGKSSTATNLQMQITTSKQRLSELEAAVAQGEHQHFRPRMVS